MLPRTSHNQPLNLNQLMKLQTLQEYSLVFKQSPKKMTVCTMMTPRTMMKKHSRKLSLCQCYQKVPPKRRQKQLKAKQSPASQLKLNNLHSKLR